MRVANARSPSGSYRPEPTVAIAPRIATRSFPPPTISADPTPDLLRGPFAPNTTLPATAFVAPNTTLPATAPIPNTILPATALATNTSDLRASRSATSSRQSQSPLAAFISRTARAHVMEGISTSEFFEHFNPTSSDPFQTRRALESSEISSVGLGPNPTPRSRQRFQERLDALSNPSDLASVSHTTPDPVPQSRPNARPLPRDLAEALQGHALLDLDFPLSSVRDHSLPDSEPEEENNSEPEDEDNSPWPTRPFDFPHDETSSGGRVTGIDQNGHEWHGTIDSYESEFPEPAFWIQGDGEDHLSAVEEAELWAEPSNYVAPLPSSPPPLCPVLVAASPSTPLRKRRKRVTYSPFDETLADTNLELYENNWIAKAANFFRVEGTDNMSLIFQDERLTDLNTAADYIVSKRLEKGSVKTATCHIRKYLEFCHRRNLPPLLANGDPLRHEVVKGFVTELDTGLNQAQRYPIGTIKNILWAVDSLFSAHVPSLAPISRVDIKPFMSAVSKTTVKKAKRQSVGLRNDHIAWHSCQVAPTDYPQIRNNLLYKALQQTVSRSEWSLPKTQKGFDPLWDLTACDVVPQFARVEGGSHFMGIHWAGKHCKSDTPGANLDRTGRDWHFTPCIVGDPTDIGFTFSAYIAFMGPYLQDPEAPFFQTFDSVGAPSGQALTYNMALAELKADFEMCPYLQPDADLGLHGLRRGGATDLLRETNVSPEDLKRIMRIRSDAYQVYNELSNDDLTNYRKVIAAKDALHHEAGLSGTLPARLRIEFPTAARCITESPRN